MLQKKAKSTLRLIATGFCMGCADIVPGVSGGTMAFILGVYEELVHSIRAFGSRDLWREIATLRIGHIWRCTNAAFLVSIGGGILLALITLAHPLETLLEQYPEYVWSFFFGLVLASIHLVRCRVRSWNWRRLLGVYLGSASAFFVVRLVPMQTPETWWFITFSGMIAICAMILPGVSGSFLLLLLGKYEFMLHVINNRDFKNIGLFLGGAAVGIVAFSHILDWLLEKYHDMTIAVLTGLMIGSLWKIWPWKEEGINMIPDLDYTTYELTGFIVLGALTVLALEYISVQKGD